MSTYRHLLQEAGLAVNEAENGQVAVEKALRIVQEITSATSHVGVGNRCVVQVG